MKKFYFGGPLIAGGCLADGHVMSMHCDEDANGVSNVAGTVSVARL